MISHGFVRKILLIAFLFIPFTSLRFSFIGIGEVLICAGAILYLFLNRGQLSVNKLIKPIVLFWCAFLFVSMLGLFVNAFVFDFISGRSGTGLFDFASYIFVLFTVVMLSDSKLFPEGEAQKFFRNLFLMWGGIFAVLYLLSLFTPSIFGLSLRYHQFFSPLVENVHQVASITCAMAFVMFALFGWSNKAIVRAFVIFMGLLFARMAIESGSTKAMMGVVVGGVVSVALFISYRPKGRGSLYYNLISFGFFAILLMIGVSTHADEILSLTSNFFTENDGGNAREMLYSNSFYHGLQSFLVGYGPGSHAPYASGFSDAHNSVLTVFLQGGIVGVLLLSALFIKIFYLVRTDFLLVGALFAILMYVIGGDVLRRLPIWVILIGVVYLSQKPNTGNIGLKQNPMMRQKLVKNV
ncbi:hypothetical protein J6J34_00920 [Pseudidiomarina sp. 1ASP75-14]|uniref:O-antigen ligase family protein n=1 Tax=Pseudidiomarina terrestris TaxID=2820060 RepID=UPI00264E3095|nr:O-antigen ligase family protein [Pseudidiomarina sp. 1ASP75-14]MDN7136778.1 hypothetical protein [Pseudidiomarina sp. 1ASP75-14]